MIENLVSFPGFIARSDSKYGFYDFITTSDPNNSILIDKCGVKQLSFYVNGTSSTIISGSNSNYFYLSPPEDTQAFGTADSKVVASLKDYPTVQSAPISF